jgi:hypothetical protein
VGFFRENAELWIRELREGEKEEEVPVVAFTTVKSHVAKACTSALLKLIHNVSRSGGGGGGGGAVDAPVMSLVGKTKKMVTVGVIGPPVWEVYFNTRLFS